MEDATVKTWIGTTIYPYVVIHGARHVEVGKNVSISNLCTFGVVVAYMLVTTP